MLLSPEDTDAGQDFLPRPRLDLVALRQGVLTGVLLTCGEGAEEMLARRGLPLVPFLPVPRWLWITASRSTFLWQLVMRRVVLT